MVKVLESTSALASFLAMVPADVQPVMDTGGLGRLLKQLMEEDMAAAGAQVQEGQLMCGRGCTCQATSNNAQTQGYACTH